MRSEKQERWYAEQKCISISKETHEILNDIRDEYKRRHRRNITLGYIVEMLMTNDKIITDIYNEIKHS